MAPVIWIIALLIARGDVHTRMVKSFVKLAEDDSNRAPPTATNQSSSSEQYTISGLSFEAVSLGTCAQVSEVEVNGIKFTGTAMPSYQMDELKIEQNVVQVSATSSIVETVAQTPASSSQCPVLQTPVMMAMLILIAAGTTLPGAAFAGLADG